MGIVVVVGSTNTDMVFTTSIMPQTGETVTGSSFEILPGGKGGNQAVAAARAGAKVHFISKVGMDDLGQAAIQNYQKDSIDTQYIRPTQIAATGTAMILVDSSTGDNSIVVVPGANAQLLPEDLEPAREVFQTADVLLVQLEIPLKTVKKALELAREYQIKTILNPAPAQNLPEDLLRLVDYITPNETETELLTGISPKNEHNRKQAARILQKHTKHVLITLGSTGVFLCDAKAAEALVPTTRVQAIDTTAAGDIFNGYLAAFLAEGKELMEAVELANRAAAISVTRKGAQPSIPFLWEF